MESNIFPYRYAKYTIQLVDALSIDETLLENLKFDNDEYTENFIRIFKALYEIYEIGGETIAEFKQFIDNKFTIWKDYYVEKLDTYYTKINFLESNFYNSTATRSGEYSNNSKDYGFPNRVTTQKYLTDEKDGSNSEEITDTKNETFGNMIDLRKQYLDAIQNIYLEFANKFQTCFILLFD